MLRHLLTPLASWCFSRRLSDSLFGICNRNKHYKSLLAIHQETFEFTHTQCVHTYTPQTHTHANAHTHSPSEVGWCRPPSSSSLKSLNSNGTPKHYEKSTPTQIQTHTHTLPTHTHRGKFTLSSFPL